VKVGARQKFENGDTISFSVQAGLITLVNKGSMIVEFQSKSEVIIIRKPTLKKYAKQEVVKYTKSQYIQIEKDVSISFAIDTEIRFGESVVYVNTGTNWQIDVIPSSILLENAKTVGSRKETIKFPKNHEIEFISTIPIYNITPTVIKYLYSSLILEEPPQLSKNLLTKSRVQTLNEGDLLILDETTPWTLGTSYPQQYTANQSHTFAPNTRVKFLTECKVSYSISLTIQYVIPSVKKHFSKDSNKETLVFKAFQIRTIIAETATPEVNFRSGDIVNFIEGSRLVF
jgi:hypothetical protein